MMHADLSFPAMVRTAAKEGILNKQVCRVWLGLGQGGEPEQAGVSGVARLEVMACMHVGCGSG